MSRQDAAQIPGLLDSFGPWIRCDVIIFVSVISGFGHWDIEYVIGGDWIYGY